MAFEGFYGQKNGYQVSKTLTFELLPQGKTIDFINERGLLKIDEQKSINYIQVKKLLDEYHKDFIDRSLDNAKLNWTDLQIAIENFQQDKNKNALSEVQAKYRSAIFDIFSKGKYKEEFTNLLAATPKNLFENNLLEFLSKNPEQFESNKNVIDDFKGFASYFSGYQKNRANVYSKEEIKTSVTYRIVNDNFPKFLQNVSTFNILKKESSKILLDAQNELSDLLNGKTLEEIFTVENYNEVLQQKGIDFYNQIIGGYSISEGKIKVRGLNEFINLYFQQNAKEEGFFENHQKVKFIQLYKQILSDRSTLSFIPEMFDSDKKVKDSILSFWNDELCNFEFENNFINVLEKIENLISKFNTFDKTKIYISKKLKTEVSRILFGNWESLDNRISVYADENCKTKKDKENLLKQDFYSVEELDNFLNFSSDEIESANCTFEDYFSFRFNKTLSVKSLIEKINADFEQLNKNVLQNEEAALREQQKNIDLIKNFLDDLQDLTHRLKPLIVSDDLEKDLDFYSLFDALYLQLTKIIPLYNKVRNYITKKPFNNDKYKLNFENPSLAKGWDSDPKNEKTKCSVLFLKDEKYYLGIMDVNNKTDFSVLSENNSSDNNSENCYKKVVYKLLPSPNKMLPKVFFSNKGIEEYKPSENLLKNYKEGKHKKGDNFNKNFMYELIDFFKENIVKVESWKNFNFNFSDTQSYNDMSNFYNEVEEQGYKLSFANIPEKTINQLVEDGKLYLFLIYNKDFVTGKTGADDIYTLYWKNLFSKENLDNVVLKLNGNAELFYRKKSIKNPTAHEVGTKLVNRTTANGKTIPDSIYAEIYRFENGKLSKLSDDAVEFKKNNQIVVKNVKHKITKDKRYTQDKFLFHVPISINFKSNGNTYINDRVRTYIKDNKDVNIIGLARGENHLLYISVINQNGEILLQKSLNQVEQKRGEKLVKVDYHEKLSLKEKERDEARKNWKSISKIAELKEGYLSSVIHELTKIMIEYNAIIVLEDLDFEFLRERTKIEKQVYQKFEKMLIDKLNYLVFKNEKVTAPGGILNGYQLASKFESFQKIGKQSGFLFYVPANYTSELDPKTGFVNLFNLKNHSNTNKKKSFFKNFKSIKYENNNFVFEFDYKDFNIKSCEEVENTSWTVHSNDKRSIYSKKDNAYLTIDPTDELKNLFSINKIDFENGKDILPEILKIDSSKTNAQFFNKLTELFELVVKMRNKDFATNTDYIISPVMQSDKSYFDTRLQNKEEPTNAAANKAFNIAKKGLLLVERITNAEPENLKNLKLAISNKDWFEYSQNAKKHKKS